jgi:hypothetical protein
LLAHDHQIGLLLVDDRFERAGDDERIQLCVVRLDQDAACGSHGERLTNRLFRVVGPERDHDGFAEALVVARVLVQPKRGLHRIVVEWIWLPFEPFGGDGAAVCSCFHLVGVVRVGDPLASDEDFHGSSW